LKSSFIKIWCGIFSLILFFQLGILTNYNNANATNAFIPDWVWNLYHFWNEERITDDELITAIEYLKDRNIIELALHEEYDTKPNFLLSINQLEKRDQIPEYTLCNSGWYTTGYFVPIELDYSGDFVNVLVDSDKKKYRIDFLDEIKTEGWGKTISGDYIGWYDNAYHQSNVPLDFFGDEVIVGTIAVDLALIKLDTELIIPTLPDPWDSVVFSSKDTGPSLKDKQIDVFTGEGELAKAETMKITGYNIVCMEN